MEVSLKDLVSVEKDLRLKKCIAHSTFRHIETFRRRIEKVEFWILWNKRKHSQSSLWWLAKVLECLVSRLLHHHLHYHHHTKLNFQLRRSNEQSKPPH